MCLFETLYKKILIKRYDDNHIIHYFSHKDFDNLKAENINFITDEGLTIRGNFYFYPSYKENRLIIFCHGIGGGHRSYMREIELLCKNGYRVLAYDNIGCFESEGKNIRAASESINDLLCVLNTLKNNGMLNGIKVSLIGHSWGGHAVSNILSYYDGISSIVCISGYASIELFLKSIFKGKHNFIRKSIIKYEKKINPNLYNSYSYNAVKDTKTKILFIHSKDDPTIKLDASAFSYKEKINNPNVQYILCEGKLHNPNYTYDAVKYMNESFMEYNKLIKTKKLKSFNDKKAYMDKLDWYRMTSQDEEIWNKILETLKK